MGLFSIQAHSFWHEFHFMYYSQRGVILFVEIVQGKGCLRKFWLSGSTIVVGKLLTSLANAGHLLFDLKVWKFGFLFFHDEGYWKIEEKGIFMIHWLRSINILAFFCTWWWNWVTLQCDWSLRDLCWDWIFKKSEVFCLGIIKPDHVMKIMGNDCFGEW